MFRMVACVRGKKKCTQLWAHLREPLKRALDIASLPLQRPLDGVLREPHIPEHH